MTKITFQRTPDFKPAVAIKKEDNFQEVLDLFSPERSADIIRMADGLNDAQEIRVRLGQAVLVRKQQREYMSLPKVSKAEMEDILERLNKSSLYALEEEYRQGFITLEGGHRVGLSGKALLQRGEIRALKDINALNIRLARNIYGAADELLRYICVDSEVQSTLLLGAPGAGKTTVLREIIRTLSNGEGLFRAYQVALADERSELAGMYEGKSSLDVGARTDVMDSCPKAQAMRMLIRSMAPEVLAADELGTREDIRAVEEALTAGIAVIATMHGKSMEDLYNRPGLENIMAKHLFRTIIILNDNRCKGRAEQIYRWQNGTYERVK